MEWLLHYSLTITSQGGKVEHVHVRGVAAVWFGAFAFAEGAESTANQRKQLIERETKLPLQNGLGKFPYRRPTLSPATLPTPGKGPGAATQRVIDTRPFRPHHRQPTLRTSTDRTRQHV